MFPFNFLNYVQSTLSRQLNSFIQMFAGAWGTVEESAVIREELETFARGKGAENSPMYVKILDSFEDLKKQQEALRSSIDSLKDMIKELEEKPKDSSYDEEIKELKSEESALISVLQELGKKNIFNFLSDEGLLPNYAFPEAGIVLKAVLYRKEDESGTQAPVPAAARGIRKYEKMVYEYSRSASSAISEFAPNNSFYVDGRKLTIDQVDLTTAQVTDQNSYTQATSDNVMTAVKLNNTVTASADTTTGIAAFTSAITFNKNTSTNECGTYWFLLEEVIPAEAENNIKDGIQYDPAKKWIQVTVSDHGDGTLTVVKDPTPTKENETDIDATFTNDRLGSVKVQKIFDGEQVTVPDDFKITAEYTLTGQDKTKIELKTTDTTNKTGAGTTESPYEWTIPDLPVGTTVTFTESGMTVDGYTVAVTGGATASQDGKTATLNAAAALDPTAAKFINTYTRDTSSLKIQKTVSVNGSTTIADTSLVDDTYTFRVDGAENTLTAGISRIITVKISGGVVTEAKDITNTSNPNSILDSENKAAVLSGLPTGQYTVTEVPSDDQIRKGITLAEKPDTAITVEKTADGVEVKTASFRNNRNVGDLEIKKKVTGTSDTTKDFTFTITLTPPDAPEGVVLENTYPVEADSAIVTNNTSCISESDGKYFISLTQAENGNAKTATVTLKANESIKIKNLPDGTGYTVSEAEPPTGYTNTTDSFNGNISSTLSSCEFINNYTLSTTSVTFGGQKSIEGTDSTEKVFCFELYETGEGYTTSASTLKQTVHTSGTISETGGASYGFDEIVYRVVQDENDPTVFTVNDMGDHYYVIKEKVFDADTYPAEGWTQPDVEYHIHVNVADGENGSLTKTVTVYDKSGAV
ncbi:MAG: DUF5979 domain-containing protein, partial [Solobacterium sp.]|nr:DUF5979 domain-containing protein [Solobacterium sp.]